MKRPLKHYLLPHKENEYKPHFFRIPTVVITLLVLGGSGFLFSKVLENLPKNDSYAAVYAGTVVAYTNEAREAVGDRDLTQNELLARAAQLKADDMATNGYFAHNSPLDAAKTSWYWFDQVGYKYEYAGENLAVNYTDSRDVTNAWLASPTHKANMLHPSFTEIGVATAIGMYKGQEVTFVVQMFGRPVPAPLQNVIKAVKVPEKNTVATTVSEKSDKEVAGAYSSEASVVDKAVTSPKATFVGLYYIFIIFVALLLLAGASMEFKRHHKSIWLASGVLILAAAGLAIFILHSGSGAIGY
jgi:uncharacterized protein YkwD